jgi:pilus assembly protein FimV
VARVNPVKAKQEADKLEKAGRYDQAIALYRQIVEDNPQDWNTTNKIGDLFAKLNRNREAAVEYAKVADYYAQDGFILKAIAIWKKINKLDASALAPYLNLAELYARQGLMMEAKSQYQIIVDEFIKRGKLHDAGEILRKIAAIDPGDLKIRSKLADLYIREGNSQFAVEEHIAIAEELNKKGHLVESLQVLEKGLRIAPTNPRLRLELARIHLLQKNYDSAVQALEEAARQSPESVEILTRLGEAYLGAKRLDQAQAVFARLIQLDPSNQEARIQIGRLHLIQGQFDRAYEEFAPIVDFLLARQESDQAIALLQQVVQRNPTHINSLLKLAEVFRSLQKESFVTATYSQLTEAYIKLGQFDQAASILDMLVSIEPENQQYKTKLAFVRERQTARPGRMPMAPPVGGLEVEDEEFDLEQPIDAVSIGGAGAVAASGPLSPEDKEYVEEHLAEGRVFRKYGLVDRAVDQFELIVQRFPDNLDARMELRDIFKEKGIVQKAAEQCRALASVFRSQGRSAEAQAMEAEAQRLQPREAPAPIRAPAAPAPRPTARPAWSPPQAPPTPVTDEEITFEEEAPLLQSLGLGPADEMPMTEQEEEIPLDVEEAAPPPTTPGEIGAESLLSDLGFSAEVEEGLPERFLDEPVAPPEQIIPEIEAPALGAESDLFGSLKEAVESAQVGQDLDLFGLDQQLQQPEMPSTAGMPSDLSRALGEIDQLVTLGFVDNAVETLRAAGTRYPGHPAVLQKISQLGLDQEEAVPGIDEVFQLAPSSDQFGLGEDLESLATLEAPVPAQPTESFDLGTELGDLFTTQAAVEEPAPVFKAADLGDVSLAEIFKEFKKGVDRQLGQEDYDTRYNLGIAYKEMGLIDEAIAEFQLAVKDESRLLECSSMLGLCFLEKGIPKLSVKWFEKGLSAPGRREEEYQGLRYDLATAYEAAGEVQKAYNLFLELYSQDASFRDVAAKVHQLQALSGG